MTDHRKINALLHLANKTTTQSRGKLKIFLGSAPGVGKTYSMLQSAHTLKANGCDIIIGLIVTHGRQETASLTQPFESIPLKPQPYKGKFFEGVDVEAIIERKPEIVMIDELAHSNIEGARNKKRYSDLIEILDAGISIYTTLNIQHIASQSQDVEHVTNARVNEIVPDSFIQSADELVVIDTTPEDLIHRLQQGKIYQEDMANRALKKYFKYTNLTILRDYTFRLAANHVGEDIRHYKKLYHKKEIATSSPSVLVCCAYDSSTPKLLRRGKQLATIANANLLAIFIHRPSRQFSKEKLREIRRYKMLAQELGYAIKDISGVKLSKSIIQYANEHNVTDIVIGKSKRPKWMDVIFGSVVYDVIRYSAGRQVHVIISSQSRRLPLKDNAQQQNISNMQDIVKAISISLIVGIGIYFSMGFIGLPAQSLVLVLVLMLCAYQYGLRASIASSVIIFVLYMYMYLRPNFFFSIGTFSQIVTFIVFMIVALTMSQLTVRTRTLIRILRNREKTLSMLYDFSNKISVQHTEDFRKVFLNALSSYFPYDFVFIDSDRNIMGSPFPQNPLFNQKEWAAAKWSWQQKNICGISTSTFSGLLWYFEPLLIDNRVLGIMAIHVKNQGNIDKFMTDQSLLKTMFSQISNLLLKRNLEKEEHKSAILEEQEKLQKAMLSSVSHDLKTPLASIMGSLSSLLNYQDMFSKEDKREMVTLAFDESKRLDQYIDNVIQMLKMESGYIKLNKSKFSIKHFIVEFQDIVSKRYKHTSLTIALPKNDAAINADKLLLQQVLFNLMDNAVKFSPENAPININIKSYSHRLIIQICDQGIGLESKALSQIFNIFYRIEKEDSYTQGNGLGLAICKGIIEAHHGSIEAQSEGLNQGTTITLMLPLHQSEILK